MIGEKSSLEKFEAHFKNLFFSLVYLLLKDNRNSSYFSVLVIIVQYFQIHYYMFHNSIRSIWISDSITGALNFFFGLFQFSTYFQGKDQSSFIVLFFILFGIIFIILVTSIYVSYYFHKTNIALVTPVTILRTIIYLSTTILYLPIIDFFAITWNCNSNGYHTLFPTQMQCWTGIHIVLTVCAFLILIVFIPLSGFLTVTFYECRYLLNNLTSRITSRPNFTFLLFQTITVLAFSVMSGSQFIYVLIVVLLGGSLLVFLSFTITHPYYNSKFQMLSTSLTAITLWTAIMMCLAKLMGGQVFQGSVIAWMVGVPFIAIIIITNRDKQIETLIINVNKFASAEELLSQTRYLLQLLQMQPTDKHSAILLDGYIEVHKQTCNKEDCPLRQKKKRNQRVTRALMLAHVEGFSEKYALLLQMLYKLYIAGLKKFANNTDLRVAFSFFLLDMMKYKQQSLQEMNVTEQYRPSFDLQFIIFRYKRIIELELQEQRKDNVYSTMDLIPSSAAPPLITSLALSIENSALMHMEFWSQLGEDTPDIGKLEESGMRTINSIEDVNDKWNKLKKVAPNHLKSLRLYARYLLEILNDEEGSDDILLAARNAALGGAAMPWGNEADQENVSTDSTPAVIVSCDSERFGQIAALNQAAASLFWYNKSELINQKIQIIMPKFYAQLHDAFVENFLNEGDSKLHQKDRVVFTKNKAGYIQQTTVSIKQLSSAIQGMSFIGTFFQEKHFKPIVYILCDEAGNFEGISQTCLTILKFDLKYFQGKRNVHELFPGILEDKLTYISKQGQPYTYVVPKEIIELSEKKQKTANYCYQPEIEQSINMLCSLQEITFSQSNVINGYIIKLERIFEPLIPSQLNSSTISKKSQNQLQPPSKQKSKNTFFFYFQIHTMKVHGEYGDNQLYSDIISIRHNESIAEMHEQSMIMQDNKKENPFEYPNFTVTVEQELKFNYGEGIKTVRLFKDRLGDIDDGNEEEMEQEEQDYEQSKQNQQQNQYYDDADEHHNDRVVFKNRKNLNNMFNKQNTPPALRNMKIVSTFLMLSILILTFIEFFLNVQQLSDIIQNIDILNQNNYNKAEYQSILGNVRDLQLVNKGLFGDNKEALHQQLISQMKASLAIIQTNLNLISLSGLSLSTETLTLYQSNAVVMQSSSTVSQTFDITQASQQMITKSFNIINTQLSLITADNLDVYFIETNGFNSFGFAVIHQSNFYLNDFVGRTQDQSSKFLIIVIIVAIILLISIVILIPVLISVKLTNEEVTKLFLEVPDQIVKQLYTKAENFVSSLQIGEDEDAVSDVDDMYRNNDQEEDLMLDGAGSKDSSNFEKRKKRRKFKSSTQTQYGFFVKLAFGAIIMESYFVFNYLIGKTLMSNFSQMAAEVNATANAESNDGIFNNIERLLFVNQNATVFNGPVLSKAITVASMMYVSDSLIHQEHSNNVKIHSYIYNDAFNNIMMQDPCSLLNVTMSECETFADGSVSQGLAVALTRFYENIRYLLSLYMRIQQQPNITFSDLVPTANQSRFIPCTGVHQIDMQLNLMNLREANETKILEYIYIKQGFRYLMAKFRDSMSYQQTNFVTERTAIFIVFNLFLFIVYILFWLPLINKLTSQIWKTRTQLVMIPVSCIIRMKNIKGYIRVVINDGAHHE